MDDGDRVVETALPATRELPWTSDGVTPSGSAETLGTA